MVSCKNHDEETHLHEYHAGCSNIFSTYALLRRAGTIPVALDTIVNADKYVNPFHGLASTAIVKFRYYWC